MADLALYPRLVGARVRSDLQYRTSFAFYLLAQALIVSLELIAVILLLQVIPTLGDWSPSQVIFLYAVASVPFALADIFVSSAERVSNYVRSGEFDRLMLRPAPILLQVSGLEFEVRRLGQLIPNGAALVWAVQAVDVDWTAGDVLYLVVTLAGGLVIYGSLWVVAASVAFWTVAAEEATRGFTYGGRFANQYPLHMYPGWLRATLGWMIPLAFVAYVPTIHLLDAPDPLGLPPWFAVAPFPVALGTAAAAAIMWRSGIRRYQSTGS